MNISKLAWRWKPKQRWLATIVTVVAMAASTLVVECRSDGSITFETTPVGVDSGIAVGAASL